MESRYGMCYFTKALHLSICRFKDSKKLCTLQLCDHSPCSCAWKTTPSVIMSHDVLSNLQKAQLEGTGLKIYLHTMTNVRKVHESYKIRVPNLIRGSPM